MKLGTESHKELFCQSFLDSYLDYQPESLPWPDLDPVSLAKLRQIPFWQQALFTERSAGVMVSKFAETIEDPLIREAIALQGREESRHGRLIEFLIQRYQIEVTEPELVAPSSQIEAEFIDFGYEECLDSFFAFGMFGIAHQANYLPEAIFKIFDPLLDEEARHIVFFVNWITYLQIQRSKGLTPLRGFHSLWHYGKAVWKLGAIFGESTPEDEKAFTVTGAGNFMDDLTPELFFATCLTENSKRMSRFNPELLQPMLMPNLSLLALRFLKLLPHK
ncbi:ferritin-like domain-containing protein [Gloeocapsa sp. PCC 73106]|uniref:ferritin-like domain-containing protein n=1 Tax=Gloeocapsa sp. PCC 73106 TaxID=102232 RepID=UPI0002ACEA2A|nr:ferritin-like domain-containing protein [Gloeocapsa sp. PCC 73106]ELR98712.1 hypothetical protein GLO73106DRAFT_00025500 [Gloeocapsa sp. PCC 73106]